MLYPHPSQQDPTQPEQLLRDVNTANAVVETIITSIETFFSQQQEEPSPENGTEGSTTAPDEDGAEKADDELSSLQRRRSQVDVLKNFFEEKSPQRKISESRQNARR